MHKTELTNAALNNVTLYASKDSDEASDTRYFFYCLGDMTGPTTWEPDKKIDIRDIASVAKLFGCNDPDTCYDNRADMNDDGKIDIKDIAMVAKEFGKTC